MSRKIIILPGWKSSSCKWQKFKQILEAEGKGIEVLTLDLPGFKPENKLTKPWALDNYVAWLADFAETRSLRFRRDRVSASFYLLGHSFGGRVALKFAFKYPELLGGLILVSSAGIKDKSLKTKMLTFTAKIAQKIKLKQCPCFGFSRGLFYKFILKKTDYLKTDDDLALKETMRMALNEDLLPLLEKIKVKTALIWGNKDKLTPLKQGKLMQKKIPNSQLLVLKDVGHTPYLECPELLAQKIIEFIS